jgi:alkyl hydroperoxide reductase subunit AhpF
VAGSRDTGVRYYGVPDGYELDVFLALLRTVGGGPSPLTARSAERLARLERALHLEVLASPT